MDLTETFGYGIIPIIPKYFDVVFAPTTAPVIPAFISDGKTKTRPSPASVMLNIRETFIFAIFLLIFKENWIIKSF